MSVLLRKKCIRWAAGGLLAALTGCAGVAPVQPVRPALEPARFADLPGWPDSDPGPALQTLRADCRLLGKKPDWRGVCAAIPAGQPGQASARAWFETWFVPWRLRNPDGGADGLITGYYEPVLSGSRARDDRYRYPVYAVPDDLIDVDLGDEYPELKRLRLRGRLEGRRLVPYYSRAQIDGEPSPLNGRALFWTDDPMALFFLHIQGAGQIRLPDGTLRRVGYADQNGHPYRALGKILVDAGELQRGTVSMQHILEWGRAHPERVRRYLDANPSYVFFRELPADGAGPPGALGVPLTAMRSIAVDPRSVPLGAPVWLATRLPGDTAPFRRLVFAQDTGGAIRGAVRADLFTGSGDAAGALAGRMQQRGRMWLLLPRATP